MTTVAPELRRPRAQVLINGSLAIPEEGNVKRNGDFQADTFDLKFPLYHDAAHPFEWWNDADVRGSDDITIEIQVGLADANEAVSSWTTVFSGLVDELDSDILAGTITVRGRDRTSLFIDTKTFKAFPNKTASEAVTDLAKAHGLTPDVQATTTKIGSYYAGNHTLVAGGQFSRCRTEWDLITALAQEEGFEAWVDDKTLHFRHVDDSVGVGVKEITFTPPTTGGRVAVVNAGSIINLKLKHNLHLSKDIKVEVRSWHAALGKKHVATSSTNGVGKPRVKRPLPGHTYATNQGKTSKDVTTYVFIFPNLDPDAAQKKADAIKDELTKHEYILTWDEPGDFSLTTRHRVKFKSTDGVLSRDFYVNDIDLTFGRNGFLMTVTAKNHPPTHEEVA